MNKYERLMMAAWIAYETGMARFPSDYLIEHCGTTYLAIRNHLPENIQYLADKAVDLVENPPKVYDG